LWFAPRRLSRLGRWTDFFAAGCTMFEMCTGFKYYQGESLVQLRLAVVASTTRCRLTRARVACKIPEPWRQVVWALTEPDWCVRKAEVACLKERFQVTCFDGSFP
jgi:serine/threonine protein kinase